MNEQTRKVLLDLILSYYGECVFVEITVDSNGMEIKTRERTKSPNFSMKNIKGEWVK